MDDSVLVPRSLLERMIAPHLDANGVADYWHCPRCDAYWTDRPDKPIAQWHERHCVVPEIQALLSEPQPATMSSNTEQDQSRGNEE